MSYMEEVAAAKDDLNKVTGAYQQRVDEARTVYNAAKKEHDAAVKDVERAIKAENRDWTKRIASFSGVSLYADHLSQGFKDFTLLSGVDARLDMGGKIVTKVTGGGRKVSLTGAMLGGMLAGPAGAVIGGSSRRKVTSSTIDERKLYLTIATVDGAISLELDPKELGRAQAFVSQVSVVADAAPERAQTHEVRLAELTEQLELVQADTAALDEAAEQLARVEADHDEVDAARLELERVRATGTEEELVELQQQEAEERREQDRSLMTGCAIMAALAILLFFAVGSCVGGRRQEAPEAPQPAQTQTVDEGAAVEEEPQAGTGADVSGDTSTEVVVRSFAVAYCRSKGVPDSFPEMNSEYLLKVDSKDIGYFDEKMRGAQNGYFSMGFMNGETDPILVCTYDDGGKQRVRVIALFTKAEDGEAALRTIFPLLAKDVDAAKLDELVTTEASAAENRSGELAGVKYSFDSYNDHYGFMLDVSLDDASFMEQASN